MPLDFNGRSFTLPLSEAPPHSVDRLSYLSLILRINYNSNVISLRATPFFVENGLGCLEDVKRTQAADEHITKLNHAINIRQRKVLRSFKLKCRIPAEEEHLPPYHGFKDSGIRLFRSQIIGIDLCAHMRRYALFFEQRCGKTLSMLGAYNRICRDDGRDYRMLVFTGKSIQHVWDEHIKEHMSGVTNVRLYEKTKKKPQIVDELKKLGKVIGITSHSLSSQNKISIIKRFDPDIIVLDESQAFKNISSQRCRHIFSIFRDNTMRFCLSGTPTGQGYIDLYAQLLWLYGFNFPPTKKAFMNMFCHTYELNNIKIISGYKNVAKIKDVVRANSYRVKQSDNFDVPDKKNIMLNVDLSEKTLSLYHQFRASKMLNIDEKVLKVRNPLVLLNKLRQFLGGVVISNYEDDYVLHKVSSEKPNTLKDYIIEETPTPKNKLVIYCVFIHEIDMICDMLNDMDISYGRISGKVPIKQTEKIIQLFQNENQPCVIVGQVKTLSAGIKLSRSKRVLFYTPDFSFQVIEQAKERIVDSSQKNNVAYIYLVVKNTIEERIIRLLTKLKKQSNYILDE